MRLGTLAAGSLRCVMDNIWSVMRLAWWEDWRLVTGRRELKALSAGIPTAQAYVGKLRFGMAQAVGLDVNRDEARGSREAFGQAPAGLHARLAALPACAPIPPQDGTGFAFKEAMIWWCDRAALTCVVAAPARSTCAPHANGPWPCPPTATPHARARHVTLTHG